MWFKGIIVLDFAFISVFSRLVFYKYFLFILYLLCKKGLSIKSLAIL